MLLSRIRGDQLSFAISGNVARAVEWRRGESARSLGQIRARLGVNSCAARLATSLLSLSWRAAIIEVWALYELVEL